MAMGSVELVGRLLDAGANPDTPGSSGYTPLMLAIQSSRADYLVQLLAAGASPNIITDPRSEPGPVSALSLTLNRGEFELARRLISSGANPFLLADPKENAANPLNLPKTRIPLDSRLFRTIADIQDAARSPDWDRFPLHEIARDGNWREARNLLDSGENVNRQDYREVTPLMTASYHGHSTLVALFLQRGASVDLRDDSGRTAITYAAASGHLDVVRRLLESAASNRSGFGQQNGKLAGLLCGGRCSPWGSGCSSGSRCSAEYQRLGRNYAPHDSLVAGQSLRRR